MGAIKAKLQSFKAPKASSGGRRGSVRMPKEPKQEKRSGGGGGAKMSPTSMFYLGRTMKRDQDAREMGEATSRIAIDQHGGNFNNAASMQEQIAAGLAQLDALLGLGQ